ncbi:MAG: leucyl/phenylalanyl-tRNA--protein transferase [Proteobacteria bacterium]|nr:leucyl/phenylalanyl-tRNA--protein transferase [Pseudomonadota bacterium]
MAIFQLGRELIFPDPSLAEPEGLLAVGGDLELDRILLAYSMGIFPWFSKGQPILWWSPDPRLILLPDQIHISKSLRRILKNRKFTVRFDTRFLDVITLCGEIKRQGQDGTWITSEMMDAYGRLHEAGFAHSVEAYFQGELVGGLYGVSLGTAFFGESMFSLNPDASKVSLVFLSKQLSEWGYEFIDCQIPTGHLKRMGAFEINRDDFLKKLQVALTKPTYSGSWQAYSQ